MSHGSGPKVWTHSRTQGTQATAYLISNLPPSLLDYTKTNQIKMGGSSTTVSDQYPYLRKRQTGPLAPWCSSATHIVNNQIVPNLYPTAIDTLGSKKLSTKIDESNKPQDFLRMW